MATKPRRTGDDHRRQPGRRLGPRLPQPAGPYFFHYTDHPPEPVFTEAPSPQASVSPSFTSLAGSPDGTAWLATASDTLYRYKRGIGWDSVRIPGWDPGKVVARPSEVNALALNAQGDGVAVGRGGRIADITGDQVKLDDASGGRALLGRPNAALWHRLPAARRRGCPRRLGDGRRRSPDAALAIGPGRSVSRRCPPSPRRRRPRSSPASRCLSRTRPGSAPTRASSFAASSTGGAWKWGEQPEDVGPGGDSITLDANGLSIPIRAISLNKEGHGYAVGDRGLILYRTGDANQPWLRLPPRFRDSFTAVQMGANDSGERADRRALGRDPERARAKLSLARPGDWADNDPLSRIGERTGPVVGLALLPGVQPGQSEAWAALSGKAGLDPGAIVPTIAPNGLLHFASDPKSRCFVQRGLPRRSRTRRRPARARSPSLRSATATATPARALRGSARSGATRPTSTRRSPGAPPTRSPVRASKPDGPSFTVFSGDAVESSSRVDQVDRGIRRFARWREQLMTPLGEQGAPLFGALGGLGSLAP